MRMLYQQLDQGTINAIYDEKKPWRGSVAEEIYLIYSQHAGSTALPSRYAAFYNGKKPWWGSAAKEVTLTKYMQGGNLAGVSSGRNLFDQVHAVNMRILDQQLNQVTIRTIYDGGKT